MWRVLLNEILVIDDSESVIFELMDILRLLKNKRGAYCITSLASHVLLYRIKNLDLDKGVF